MLDGCAASAAAPTAQCITSILLTVLESGGGGGSRGEVVRGSWAGGGLAWLAPPSGSTSHPPLESILCVALRPSQLFGSRVWVNIYSSCFYSVRPSCQMRLACSSTELSWLSTQSDCCRPPRHWRAHSTQHTHAARSRCHSAARVTLSISMLPNPVIVPDDCEAI